MGVVMRVALVDEPTNVVMGIALVGEGYTSPEGYVIIPDPPADVGQGWLWVGDGWGQPDLDIEVLRAQAHAVRRAERDRRQFGSFPYDGHRYACDRDSILRIGLSAAKAAQSIAPEGPQNWSAGSGWRDTEGVVRITDAETMQYLEEVLFTWIVQCDQASQALKHTINMESGPGEMYALIEAIPGHSVWPV